MTKAIGKRWHVRIQKQSQLSSLLNNTLNISIIFIRLGGILVINFFRSIRGALINHSQIRVIYVYSEMYVSHRS